MSLGLLFEFNVFRLLCVKDAWDPAPSFYQEHAGLRVDPRDKKGQRHKNRFDVPPSVILERLSFKEHFFSHDDWRLAAKVSKVSRIISTARRSPSVCWFRVSFSEDSRHSNEAGVNKFEPVSIHVVVCMERELVAVEHVINPILPMKNLLNDFLRQTVVDWHSKDLLRLEPIPIDHLVTTFKSFDKLTYLKLQLCMPGMNLSLSQRLFAEMEAGNIGELVQEMRNPQGISQEGGKLPLEAIELAAAGFKNGPIEMEGVIDNKIESMTLGKIPVRGKLMKIGSSVHNALNGSKSAKGVISLIFEEIDKLVPSFESRDNSTKENQFLAGMPVEVYLPDANQEDDTLQINLIKSSVTKFLASFALIPDPGVLQVEESGSWRWFNWFRPGPHLRNEASDVYEEIREAIRRKHIDVEGATSFEKRAIATAELIKSIEPYEKAVMRLGDVIVCKITKDGKSEIFVEIVSAKLARQLDKQPGVLEHPDTFLAFLKRQKPENPSIEDGDD